MMYDKDSNVEKLAGYGLMWIRWEIFQFKCLVWLMIIGFFLYLGIFIAALITTPDHRHTPVTQQQSQTTHPQQYQIVEGILTPDECNAKGYIWITSNDFYDNQIHISYYCGIKRP